MGYCVDIENGMVAGTGWDRGWEEARGSSFLMLMALGVGHRVVEVSSIIALEREIGSCTGTVLV